jgi:hypothetical protein
MKNINTYIVLVDSHRNPDKKRNTSGRYRVGAKTPKEAEELLQKAIGFGSVQTYYECNSTDLPQMKYREIKKEKRIDGKVQFVDPRHATDQIKI